MANPAAVVLDVNETLFALDCLDPLFERWGVGGERDLWFARTLRTGFALTAAGQYRSFPEVARQALVSLAPELLAEAEADELLGAFASLEPHPEVQQALALLRNAHIPVVTLSVGNAANVERLFVRAGLDALVSTHLSCEEVRRWKPAPE
ncbi:MAG TPA: haloacid dehalogenase-like hydrolase, partial [Candidatus Nanopelagicales bacterium]|nr:haloacid dehalogenase-like hydrolase [Candidatus Nanopelagicales bacterium]